MVREVVAAIEVVATAMGKAAMTLGTPGNAPRYAFWSAARAHGGMEARRVRGRGGGAGARTAASGEYCMFPGQRPGISASELYNG